MYSGETMLASRLSSFFAACALAIALADAAIHTYDGELLSADTIVYRQSGMFSMRETPAKATKYSQSVVRVDLTFERLSSDWPGEETAIELLLFKKVDGETTVGYTDPSTGEFWHCCTPELVKAGICNKPYRLIVDATAPTTSLKEIEFPKRGSKTTPRDVHSTFSVDEKGLYYLMFASCNDLTGGVSITGHTEWINPYGYLPGELYGFMPFYGRISVTYLVVAFFWMITCFRNFKQLLMLQTFITAVMALGMIEMLLRYYDFHDLNKHGTRNMPLMLSAVLFTSIKKVISRMLVLIVSMGYGVVRPSLGEGGYKVAVIGAMYFAFASVQHAVESVSHSEKITFSKYLLLLPVALLDVLFYFWIFRALIITIKTLEIKRQNIKLVMYVRFQRILYLSVLVSLIWGGVYAFVIVTGRIEDEWQNRWIYEGFWDCIYFGILLTIMVLWKPSKNARRYAYQQVGDGGGDSDFDTDDEDDLFDPNMMGAPDEFGLDDGFSFDLKEVELALSGASIAAKGNR